ncbi:MAG: hypothetical protein ABH826_05140 [Patescibacteria group bacterium]
MSDRSKKILGFIALFTIAGLFAAFIYFALIKAPPSIRPTTGPEVPGAMPGLPSADTGITLPTEVVPEPGFEGLPPSAIADGGLVLTTRLTSSAITSPQLTSDGSIAFYDPADGRFYTIDENGNILPLSDKKFPDAEKVTFADTADVAAIEFPDGTNIIYDFNTAVQTTLPKHWDEFDFDPDGQEVQSKNLTADPNTQSIVITSTDGTRTEVVAALGTKSDSVTLDWSPNDSIIGFSDTGVIQSGGFGRNQIYILGRDGEAAGSIVVEGTHFSSKWSPDGSHIVYSIADRDANYRPVLWYVKATGTNIGTDRKRLGVETPVEKCAFASETLLYCAVPREMPGYAGEDIRLITAPDDVYSVNIATGRSVLVGAPVTDFQMFNLSVSQDGSILYFTDQAGRLNTMRLK